MTVSCFQGLDLSSELFHFERIVLSQINANNHVISLNWCLSLNNSFIILILSSFQVFNSEMFKYCNIKHFLERIFFFCECIWVVIVNYIRFLKDFITFTIVIFFFILVYYKFIILLKVLIRIINITFILVILTTLCIFHPI